MGFFVEDAPLGTVLVADEGGTKAEPTAEEVLLMAVETKLDVGGKG